MTMSTVGYGDISAVNEDELMLSVITMLICCGVFAYVINSVGVIFEDFGAKRKVIEN